MQLCLMHLRSHAHTHTQNNQVKIMHKKKINQLMRTIRKVTGIFKSSEENPRKFAYMRHTKFRIIKIAIRYTLAY